MVEKFIMAADTALHICDSEKGDKCLILLHGYLESMLIWDDFVAKLYKSMRVITIDIPGHGISEVKGECHSMEYLADTIHSATEKLGISSAYILGHSMGGYIAMEYLRKYPDQTEGIILLSSMPDADSEEKIKNREREIKIIKSGKKELLAKVVPGTGFAPANRSRLQPYIEDMEELIHITEDEGIIALINGMKQRKDQIPTLKANPGKYMFILGVEDEYIPKQTALETLQQLPDAKIEWMEKSGHMAFIEQEEECAKIVLDYVLK